LRTAADDRGAAFFLARLTGRGVEIIHVETPRDERVAYLHPGLGFRPLHACSCAKAIAAFSNEPTLISALQGKLRTYTDHTRTDLDDLETEFDEIRKQGFAECVQELEVGMCSVAAPVLLPERSTILSLGATGSVRQFTEDFRAALGLVLIEMAGALAEVLEGEAGRAIDRPIRRA
jgi:DNA-binding IclR family transcriptional regulator